MLRFSNKESQHNSPQIATNENVKLQVNNGSRLKSSTIFKTPPTKSSLMQPVASVSEQRPNVVAKESAIRLRPTSLALKNNLMVPKTCILSKSKPKPANSADKLQPVTKSPSNGSIKAPMQVSAKRKSFPSKTNNNSATASSSGLESRLGRFRELTNALHPHSQRVNSAKTSITVNDSTNKLKSTKGAENRKVNSNHKDVNGNTHSEQNKEESKQDANQTVARQLKTPTTTTSRVGYISSLNRATNVNATIRANKNDQFVGRLISAPATTDKHSTYDKKQHGNMKQLGNKLMPRHTLPGVEPVHENHKQKAPSNCYNNHDGAKSSLTKSPQIHFKNYLANDRILPKPMGQQVLSLMMLDVGLMPANNHQPTNNRSPSKSSHVSLQDCAGRDVSGASSHLSDNNNLLALSTNKLNGNQFEGCSIDYHEQSNNYHSLEAEQETLRLQVRLSKQDNEHLRSISLPSSPRKATRRGHQIHDHLDKAQLLKEMQRDNSVGQPLSLLEHPRTNCKPTLLSVASPSVRHSEAQEQLFSLCDKQDSHSLTSSSCSSLSHCPPLLALSNQLDSLQFEELIRTNVDLATKRKQNNSPASSVCFNQATKLEASSIQVAQVAKQHDLLTNDLNCGLEKHHSKIDRVHQIKDLFTNDEENSNIQQGPQMNHLRSPQVSQPTAAFHGDESFLSSQLSNHMDPSRRQQPRSNSISGQEFHSNGGYQRLKQLIYTQQSMLDGYHQNFDPQFNNRRTQIPSPYQQQHQPLDRSPSPLGINYQTNFGSHQRESSVKQFPLDRQPRNQLHASLECLNTAYSDYQKEQLQHRAQHLQHQHLFHQQGQVQNQHYAASYVLAPPPPNSVVNQNGDQDLAAAAMGTPFQYQSMGHVDSTSAKMSPYNAQNQNLINRALNQVSQSPLRRIGLNNVPASSVLINQLTSQHPMRAGHSSLSLASSSFIVEDKLQNEIRKLHSELKSEREKNEALNSQLNINSSLMAAFEQSLTTLNTRLRQLTTLNEKKDNEIEELKDKLSSLHSKDNGDSGKSLSPSSESHNLTDDIDKSPMNSERDTNSERNLIKVVEDLKRQLIEKDRLLTDTRLEALSAAHQLERLEAKLNGEQSMLTNEDDLDEGVMVVNHSPSDSDVITDSAHFSEINSQISKSKQQSSIDEYRFMSEKKINDFCMASRTNNAVLDVSIENNNIDDQSNHSSDYQVDSKTTEQHQLNRSISQQFEDSSIGKLVDNLL